MAAKKYVSIVSGILTEIIATVTSSGAGDDGKIPALDSSGKLDLTLMPVGVGPETSSIEASENISAGDLVNLHDATGVKVRKADASNGRIAHGFALASITSGQSGTIYFEGSITGLSGLTPGATMFLSGSSAGAATATPVSTSGYSSQQVGVAISTTAISFSPQAHVVLA
jgi:hypothetical protein